MEVGQGSTLARGEDARGIYKWCATLYSIETP